MEEKDKYKRANDIYFDLYLQDKIEKKIWQKVAFSAIAAVLILSSALVVLLPLKKLVPIVISVNKLGKPKVSRVIVKDYTVNHAAKEYFVGRWIHWMFDINSKKIVYMNIQKGYLFLTAKGINYYKSYFTVNNPFTWLKKHPNMTVHFQIQSFNFIDPKIIQVNTIKRIYNPDGTISETDYVNFIVHIELIPPTSTKVIETNPLGIYISEFSVNKKI